MTMLIELDSDNRASLRTLFDRYPCLHGVVAAVIEGGMGRVFADAQAEPQVALAVLDFHLLAGDPLDANVPLLFKQLQPGNVVIAPTLAWRHLVTATYPDALTVYRREAFQVEQFDADKLRRFCQALPGGFELRQVRLEELPQFATDLDRALISTGELGSPRIRACDRSPTPLLSGRGADRACNISPGSFLWPAGSNIPIIIWTIADKTGSAG